MSTSLDDLVSMAVFARVVEAKSFTAAAALLGVSKSIVSKRVSALERQYGAPLLHRTTRRLSLTSDGARLFERCSQLVRVADDAPSVLQRERGEPYGVLRISCATSFAEPYVADVVARFVSRYRKCQVEMCVSNAMVDLVSERVDVALRIAGSLQSSSLVARRLGVTRRLLCASPDYVRRYGSPRTPDDLRAHACLRFTPLRDAVEWQFARQKTFVPISGPFEADSLEALTRAAVRGVGILVVPEFMVSEELASGALTQLLSDHPLGTLGVFAVYAKGKVVPAKIRRFVELLAAHLGTLPGLRAATAG